MKANEAPEKIYLYPSDRAGEVYEYEWYDKPWGEGCVEYTRTNAFIEKAKEWLKNFNDFYYIMRYSDCCEVPLDQIIDDFKNYIIEEKV